MHDGDVRSVWKEIGRGRGDSASIHEISLTVALVSGGNVQSNCDSAAWQLWHTSGLNTVRLTSGKQYNTDSRAKACRKSTRLVVLISSGNVTQKWYQNDGHVMMKSSSTTVNQIKAQTGKKLNNQPNKQKQQSVCNSACQVA